MEWMIEHDADINTKDNLGWNALMFSVDNDQGDIARILLDHGADAGKDMKLIFLGKVGPKLN